jgi:hypothetical protein
MSSGCSCGKEKWDYEECVAGIGMKCTKYWLVRFWEDTFRNKKDWSKYVTPKRTALQFWQDEF